MYEQKRYTRMDYVDNKILEVLFDKIYRDILIYLAKEPQSVSDIIKSFGIPKSTAYRMINKLQELNLIKISSSIINKKGRRTFMYKSKIKKIDLILETNGLAINIEYNKLED
jgi:predicted transcriptional regulator